VLGSHIKNVNCVGICYIYEATAVIEPNSSLHRVGELCQGDTQRSMRVIYPIYIHCNVYIYIYIYMFMFFIYLF
jgi:hypothetical protein